MSERFKPEPDKHAAFVAEAMLLRALYWYRAARDRAKDNAVGGSFHGPELPSYAELSANYEKLLDEWATERPDSPHGVLSYVNLVTEIIADQLASQYREEGCIVIIRARSQPCARAAGRRP